MANADAKAAVAGADQAARTPAEPVVRMSDAEKAVAAAVESGGTAYQDSQGTWRQGQADLTRVLFGDNGQWAVVDLNDRLLYQGQALDRRVAVLDAHNPQQIAEAALRLSEPVEESEAEKVQRAALRG